jgi:hypothetical protein
MSSVALKRKNDPFICVPLGVARSVGQQKASRRSQQLRKRASKLAATKALIL